VIRPRPSSHGDSAWGVTSLVHQDVKVYWITVGVLGSWKRAPVCATPISLSDPGSFADDVNRAIVNELAAV
jgi:hypothetical protein